MLWLPWSKRCSRPSRKELLTFRTEQSVRQAMQSDGPPMTPKERSLHAMLRGQKLPENMGLLLTTKETANLESFPKYGRELV